MKNNIYPKNYKSLLNLVDTQIAIKFVKDTFERELAKELKLTRVSAPLFVEPETGLNDNLSGYEKAVNFVVNEDETNLEIVQSLAKWKRDALARYGIKAGQGLYTDMNAIRMDETLDKLHSAYVDQWDWEKVIFPSDRNLDYLFEVVRKIYSILFNLAKIMEKEYSFHYNLPANIKFISSEELLKMFPNLSQKERELMICKQYMNTVVMKLIIVLFVINIMNLKTIHLKMNVKKFVQMMLKELSKQLKFVN